MGSFFSQPDKVDQAASKVSKAVDKGAKNAKQAAKDVGKAVEKGANNTKQVVKETVKEVKKAVETKTKKKNDTLLEVLPFVVVAVGVGVVWLVREKPWNKKKSA